MAADLFNQKFLSHKIAAWHGLGYVTDEEMTAVDAFQKIGGYIVTLEDLYTIQGQRVSARAVVRQPMLDSLPAVELGIVGSEYVLIPPQQICEVWDASVRAPVETIGALANGSTLFISTFLPTIDIRGDEVKTYLLLISPMSGMEALQTRVTGVRVVCSNTLQMAKQNSSEVYRVVHDKHAMLKLQAALDGVYARAAGRVQQFKELFELMADKRVTNDELNVYIESVYVLPQRPNVDGLPTEIIEGKLEIWESNTRWFLNRREMAYANFQGAGTGMDLPSTKGTLWGAYNSVTETETHSKGGSLQSRGTSLLTGTRGAYIEKAYDEALKLVK